MKRRHSQISLGEAWSATTTKSTGAAMLDVPIQISTVPRRHEITAGDVIVASPQSQFQLIRSSNDMVLANELDDPVVSSALKCSTVCCVNEMEAYQPKQNDVLLQFSRKGRHFTPSWYNKYPGRLYIINCRIKSDNGW